MNKILEYQKLDGELNKLNKSLKTNENQKIMYQMSQFVKDAQNKSGELETLALSLTNDYQELTKKYNSCVKEIEKVVSTNVEKITSEDSVKLGEQINKLSSQLFMTERSLNQIILKAKDLLRQFEGTRKNAVKAREKHEASKLKLNSFIDECSPKIEAIKKEMAKLEKDLDKDLLAKYKSLRSENLYPVFVVNDGNKCNGCRMELPSSQVTALKSNKFIVCEHCGRLIYNK